MSESSIVVRQAFRALPSGVQLLVKAMVDDRTIQRRERSAEQALRLAAERLSDMCLTGLGSKEDWESRGSGIREALRWMLGLEAVRARELVPAQCTGVVEQPLVRMEKWLLQSAPGLYITANLYIPKEGAGPHPCILYQSGHWPSLDGAKTGFQDRYLWYPENGFALLVIDPMGFGEIPGIHPGTNRLNRWDWLSKGYTPAGVEIWNAMCAIDWLQTRTEIDSDRIGATGISGGGVMTQYLAAIDERVKVAAPSCSTFTIGHQLSAGLVPQQCDCTFYTNVFGLDFPDVLALIAPRPLLILGGRKDPIFPPAGFRAAFERVRRVYQLYGNSFAGEDRIRLVESSAGHTDPPHFLEETRAWMCHWLQDDLPRERSMMRTQAIPKPPAELRVIQRSPVDAVNAHIDELWLQAPQLQVPATTAEAEERRTFLMQVLQSRLFRWFPEQDIPFRIQRRPYSGGYAGEMADFLEVAFDTEPDVPIGIRLLRPRDVRGPVPTVIWVKAASENVAFPDIDEFLPLLRSHAVAILTPRFADRPLSSSDYARIERSAALLGRSIASIRVWDVLRCIRWLRQEHGLGAGGLSLYGTGENGILGLYAALLDAQVTQVVLREPPKSHRSGPILPTILRDTDIEEVAGLLAPRLLSVLGATDELMPITRGWFQLFGANENFRSQPSLLAAVQSRPTKHFRSLQP